MEVFARHGVALEVHHVSGHAYERDLRRLVDAVQPDKVIPIHTADPERNCACIPKAERKLDGDWWSV
jgi:ribonuclease J